MKFSNGNIVPPEGVKDWLQCVQPARDRHEQNLEAFCDSSRDSEVAVRTLRTLQKGEQLFVWYNDQLARETGIPVLTPENIKGKRSIRLKELCCLILFLEARWVSMLTRWVYIFTHIHIQSVNWILTGCSILLAFCQTKLSLVYMYLPNNSAPSRMWH